MTSPILSAAERDAALRPVPRSVSLRELVDYLGDLATPLAGHHDPAVRRLVGVILERGPGAC